jgi:hypothetical protein
MFVVLSAGQGEAHGDAMKLGRLFRHTTPSRAGARRGPEWAAYEDEIARVFVDFMRRSG